MNTPLSPLQKRGNQIAFPFLISGAKNYFPLFISGEIFPDPPLRKRG